MGVFRRSVWEYYQRRRILPASQFVPGVLVAISKVHPSRNPRLRDGTFRPSVLEVYQPRRVLPASQFVPGLLVAISKVHPSRNLRLRDRTFRPSALEVYQPKRILPPAKFVPGALVAVSRTHPSRNLRLRDRTFRPPTLEVYQRKRVVPLDITGPPITIDNAGQSGSTVSATTVVISSFVVGSGSNRLLLVGVSMNNHVGDGPTQVDTVTFGAASLTLIGTVTQSDDARVEIWKLLSPAVSTADITVTVDRNTGGCGIVAGAMSFKGVDQTTPTSAISGAVGISSAPSVSISSAVGELVFDTVSLEDIAGSVGSGQTERWSVYVAATQEEWGAGSTESGASSVTMSWSSPPGDNWAIGAVAIKPAAAAAGNPWYAYAQQ